MKLYKLLSLLLMLMHLISCTQCRGQHASKGGVEPLVDSLQDTTQVQPVEPSKPLFLTADEIEISKDLLFDKYVLEDVYPYQKGERKLQWDSIRAVLAHVENLTAQKHRWGILQNYRNGNKEAALVKNYKRNVYKRIADTLGVERWQSVALYSLADTLQPERYGRDGWPVLIQGAEGSFARVKSIEMRNNEGEEWFVYKRYLKELSDSLRFEHLVVVDRKSQYIISLEKTDKAKWLVRSINPATTGVHRPPYAQETPLGIFVVQEKKSKMFYHKDGTTEMGGFAPWASRFTNGAYIHGVPVNLPRTSIIEYSQSLGTTPRSHMCVRNASSHAKFIYDRMPTLQTLVVVIE